MPFVETSAFFSSILVYNALEPFFSLGLLVLNLLLRLRYPRFISVICRSGLVLFCSCPIAISYSI